MPTMYLWLVKYKARAPSQKVNMLAGVAQILIYSSPSPKSNWCGGICSHYAQQSPFE